VNSFYLKKFADALGKDEEYFKEYKDKASWLDGIIWS
jgi:hypothetical protein